MPRLKLVLIFVISALLAACGNLMSLRDDLIQTKNSFIRLSGDIDSPYCSACPIIVVAMGDRTGKDIHAYRVFEGSGKFQMMALVETRHLFAFNDLNNDFEYQPDEPSGWYDLPATSALSGRVDRIDFDIKPLAVDATGWPAMGNLFDLRKGKAALLSTQLGLLVSLDDPRFDADLATLGMWQPLHFARQAYVGIYFVEEYSPVKTPVLFVHGINGSPRDFALMVAKLDRKKFQPWFLYYPSGLDLRVLGDGLFGMLSELNHRYPFNDLHIVAHSMGGLVARSFLSGCVRDEHCDYVRSFTSISSPFGGQKEARNGIDYSPVIMPVWKSIVPDSRFLQGLFRRPLPSGVPHYLLFSYQNISVTSFASGDGTILLTSQLRPEAQAQATALRGFDEDHMGILANDAVNAYLNGILTTHDPK
jgi:pimeloyl-ACP methyl ester carboxylesterase